MYVFSSGRSGRCWGEWVRGLGLGFTNPGGTGETGICVCVFVVVVWVVLAGGVGGRLGPVSWCVGSVKSVFVVSLNFLC